ncbi:HD-GYP domain-containing protein [Erwiniaceae bacterium BAC15a-03b]|uniref:HD-GYP domain-containing protein n=1 Tax=Winslowiella arboricola TaxID=2978220 RepID=A0A9J6PPT7_9GAMM|nr:HD-GYP domain-containing protein [Winslowiella arboricola]MCU5773791.1 HD-GYP domain-containing protein [Winslowiella arboricola]MCU5777701.1 HD-GYP domain-containing protein [Winslowiella arboricola]
MIKLIPTQELQLGMYIHKLGVFWIKHPLISNRMLLTDSRQITAIAECGIGQVWVDMAKSVVPKQAAAVTDPAAAPAVPPPGSFLSEVAHAQRICQQGTSQIKAMFGEARLGKTVDVQSTLSLVEEITGSVDRHPSALINVARLKDHDDYTYLHSVAVCALMIGLGRRLQLDDHGVRLAGLGGLLHDLGKAHVALEILNKPGKLTDEEFSAMKRHPLMGAEMLFKAGASDEVIDIALHHHEKVDGSGYPYGLKGNQISDFARMAAVCDVYDAVTSNRPYRDGWNPADAMHRMANWGGHFDKAMFYAFVKSVGIYPVGSLVRLSSGRVAMVVEAGNKSLLHPKVHVFWSLQTGQPLPVEPLDLADGFSCDSIISPEDMAHWKHINFNQVWMV